jgi:hypothetical protein
MKTLLIFLIIFISACACLMQDNLSRAGTPFDLFYLFICYIILFVAVYFVMNQRRVVIGYILTTGLMAVGLNLQKPAPAIAYILFAHSLIGVMVLAMKRKKLKP